MYISYFIEHNGDDEPHDYKLKYDESGHETQVGLDTKTEWLAVRQP